MKRSNWKVTLWGLLFVLVFVLAACGNTTNTTNTTNNTAPQTSNDASNEVEPAETEQPEVSNATQYPYTVTDSTNTEITLAAEPARIISIVPSETEVVFAIGKGDVVVGVDANSNYPENTADIEKVGDFNTNIEAVVALNPDLVLASSSMNGEAITKLRELGITVFASDPLSYDEVVEHIKQVGVLLNEQELATAVANEMLDVKKNITDKVAGVDAPKVYLEFSTGWTMGSGTFMDELVTIAGGANIAAAQEGWFEVDAEAVITENPAVIIYPDGWEESSTLEAIKSRPGWEVIDAVKNDNLVVVSNDQLVRVGPRLSQGLTELAKAIHPELFQ